MVFQIRDKVALITGGASGAGLEYAKALLRNGLKAVTLVDVNPDLGDQALLQIASEFDANKAIFVRADVSDINQLEDAFKKTVDNFKNLDIVFNNAGILNDSIWEKEIIINLNGVINGILLALEKYLPTYQQGPEAVIVNISSIAGLQGAAHVPVYGSTKHAIIGLTRSWGQQVFYDKFKVRVVAICPGVTITPLISDVAGKSLGKIYEENRSEVAKWPVQKPEILAKEAMEVVKYAPNGSLWVVEGGEPAYQYIHPDRHTMKNNVISRI